MPSLLNVTSKPRPKGPNPAMEPSTSPYFYGPHSYGGPRVTDAEAVEFTAVYRALNIIASTLGTLPIHVFDRNRPETEKIRTPATKYLWGSPNHEDTRFTFWSGLFADHVMDGNAFIHVVKNDMDRPLQLWALDPARVEVGRLGPEFSYLKVYRIDGKFLKFDFSAGGEIVHVLARPDSKNRLVGFNPRRSLYRTLGLSKAADESASSTWAENAVPPGVLSSDQPLDEDIAKIMQDRWHQRGAGRIAVLGQGLKFERVSITPLEAQTLDSRRFSVTEIFRHFGIPSHLGNDTEKTTSWGSGLFEITKAFQSYTLAHTYGSFEQAVEKHLLGERNLYMRYEMGGLLRGSKLEQYQAHRLALAGQSWMTVNEVRSLDELPPIEGGDELATPLNMTNPGSLAGEDAAEDPVSEPTKARSASQIETEGMARAFLNGASYGQIAIEFGVQGADPTESVKKRVTKHLRLEYGVPPIEARKLLI